MIEAMSTLACAVPIASGVAVASGRPSRPKTSSRRGTAMIPPPTPSNPANTPIAIPPASSTIQAEGG